MLSSMLIVALNRLLEREVWARQALLEHVGSTARVTIAGVTLRFKVEEQGVLSAVQDDTTPTVSIEIPAAALPQLFDGIDTFSRHARVSGDAHFAETVARLLRHLRPDLGAALSPIFGNIMAHRIEQGLQTVASSIQDTTRNFGSNVLEYVSEEKALVVKRSELENRDAELARLRDDLARLEKRVERISAR